MMFKQWAKKIVSDLTISRAVVEKFQSYQISKGLWMKSLFSKNLPCFLKTVEKVGKSKSDIQLT